MMTEETMSATVTDALRRQRQKGIVLVGYLERNQGLPTFTGRMSLEQFCDLTVVHNRKWAEEAGESLDVVTQREIIDAHANGLGTFMLKDSRPRPSFARKTMRFLILWWSDSKRFRTVWERASTTACRRSPWFCRVIPRV